MPRLRPLAMLLATGLAGPALAEGFAVHDLGEMPTREVCMQRATKVLNAYLRQEGGFEVQTTDWVVYGWDLGPGDNDVTVMCPILRDQFVNAMMVVYGEGSDADRQIAAETIDAMWFN